MIVKIQRNQDPFARIDRRLAQDTNLSFAARGLMTYLLSMADNWTIRLDVLRRENGIGRDALRTLFKELQAKGYAELYTEKGGSGQFKGTFWLVREVPISEPERKAA